MLLLVESMTLSLFVSPIFAIGRIAPSFIREWWPRRQCKPHHFVNTLRTLAMLLDIGKLGRDRESCADVRLALTMVFENLTIVLAFPPSRSFGFRT